MSTTQKKIQNTALEMFRKYKGTYSQNDMEKIVEEALQQERSKALKAITEAFWDGVEQGGTEYAGDCFIAEDYLNNSRSNRKTDVRQ